MQEMVFDIANRLEYLTENGDAYGRMDWAVD